MVPLSADRIIYLLANALFIYSYYRIYGVYFDRSKTNKWLETGCFIAYYLINSTCFLLFATPYLNLAINTISLVGIAFLYPGRIRTKFAVPLLCFAFSMVLDNLLNFLFLWMELSFEQMMAMINLLVAIIWHFIALVLRKRKTPAHHYRIEFLHWLAICFIPFGSMVVIASMFYFNQIAGVMMIASCVLLFINVLVFYLFDTLGQYCTDHYERQLLEQQNHAYREEFALMRQAQQHMKTLRHDMKNHLSILRQYADDGHWTEMYRYLDEFAEKLTGKVGYVHTGNPDLDSILNYKLGQAEAAGASLTLNVLLPENFSANAFDLNVVLGNLLDNAIEGIANTEEKQINLVLRHDCGVLFIHVDNSYDGVVHKESGKPGITYRSRKQDKTLHGFGIASVKTVIEKYNGQLEIDSTGTSFTVEVMLYL